MEVPCWYVFVKVNERPYLGSLEARRQPVGGNDGVGGADVGRGCWAGTSIAALGGWADGRVDELHTLLGQLLLRQRQLL